ncbi:MAG: GWxTD domain-containing protein [Rhodothermales bacterium]|nr:GWxTD domain-containing protein [Rhodothermales bacterium]
MRFLLVSLLLVLLGLPFAGSPRVGYAQSTPAPGFNVDVVSTKAPNHPGQARLDLYASIPFNALQFLKAASGFSASFDLYAEVHRLDDRNEIQALVENPAWEATAQAEHFTATQSPLNAALTSRSIYLEPGRYRVQIQVQDRASGIQMRQELMAEVRDFSPAVTVSDLILVNDFSASTQSIVPRVSDRLTVQDESFKFFYEVYADTPAEVRVERVVIRTQKSKTLPFLGWFLRRWRDEEPIGEVAYHYDAVVGLKKGRNPIVVTVPLQDYEVGEYILRVALRDADGRVVDLAERAVSLLESEARHNGRDIDEAIDQLAYVAKARDLRYIREGTSKQERFERFMAFWQKRDPTPATPDANERMDEYYHRIDFANRHYAGQTGGWQSDRGHALVLFGEPDEVEQGQANADVKHPYEVWHYRRIGRRFVFIDDVGRGEFRLISPPWDERSSIR